MKDKVKAKKHLGQHFLNDEKMASNIVKLLQPENSYSKVLEIGPGMGVLTKYLLERPEIDTHLVELDSESVAYLKIHYPQVSSKIYACDFLHMDLNKELQLIDKEPFGIIGNFPYNISSQIFFRVLEYLDQVEEVVCMLQKEVAKRIASGPGNKDYGILSVLLQAYFDIDYHYNVPPGAFTPPPKVDSGIIRLKRIRERKLSCSPKLFKSVVKVGFNQRRKKLSNALKPMGLNFEHPLLDKRAEQLSWQDFETLTLLFEQNQSTSQA